MSDDKIVHIVHAIDTEGPLYESLAATFERINSVFGIDLPPSHETLEDIRAKKVDLGGKEDLIADFVDPFRIRYHETWDSIDGMLAEIMSPEFRSAMPDSFGGGWVYNWHCVDHVGYEINPRRKDLGIHNIFDRYTDFLDKYQSAGLDSIEWHHHPMSTYREAHRCATSYENSEFLHPSICRKIIERGSFPAVHRAGFHTERPDSHWFLEQWIPFDCSNISTEDISSQNAQNDVRNGRFGDWRRATTDWRIYNPDFHDYQVPGNCNRYIARFLNIDTRVACIDQDEVNKAFAQAQTGEMTLMGLISHDYRDMAVEVRKIRQMIETAASAYPDVKFRFSTARQAFNDVLHGGEVEPLELDVDLKSEDGKLFLSVNTRQGKVFGSQPYLAVQTRSQRFIHDNFDYGLDGRSWHYVFDEDSIRADDVETIGIAANNRCANTFIKLIRP